MGQGRRSLGTGLKSDSIPGAVRDRPCARVERLRDSSHEKSAHPTLRAILRLTFLDNANVGFRQAAGDYSPSLSPSATIRTGPSKPEGRRGESFVNGFQVVQATR